MNQPSRHLALPLLLDHVSDRVAMVYPFPGLPYVDLLIDGSVPKLVLRAEVDQPSPPPLNTLRHVAISPTFVDGRHFLEVAISGALLLVDGHSMLCAIADRIQLEGSRPSDAVADTLAQWRAVLATRTRMTVEAEVGLFGELLLLEALAVSAGAQAVEAWRGSLSEEHDFGLGHSDVEVKATSGERREHWISGLTQLRPTADRTLILVSFQLTRGGRAGRTLTHLVGTLEAALPHAPFHRRLSAAGWSPEDADLYVDRWRMRTAPRAYVVDSSFPALTPELLADLPRDLAPVRDVRYKIDLRDRLVSLQLEPQLAQAMTTLGNGFEE